MSKKNKKSEQEQQFEENNLILEQKKQESQDVKEENLESAVKKEKKSQDVALSLSDAARRLIDGFKDHWVPSISKFAQSQGFSDLHSLEDWKKLFKDWGAKIK